MMVWKRVSLPLVVLLGLSCAGNPPPSDPAKDVAFFPETITITGLEATDTGEATDVVVKGNFPFNYSSFEPDPSRLVIEVPGADANALDDVIPINTDEVEQVMVTTDEYPGGSRIARLEFTGLTSVRHDVFLEENHLRIRFFGPDGDTGTGVAGVMDSAGRDAAPEDEDWIWDEDADTVGTNPQDSGTDEELPWLTGFEDETGFEGETGSGRETDGMDLEPVEDLEPVAEPVPEPAPEPVLPADPAAALLNVRNDGPEKTTVQLLADGRLEYRDFRLENPDRAVVDLIGITNRVPFRALNVDSEILKQVRVAQFQTTPEKITRVVFDMSASRDYRIEDTADGLQVRFAPAGGFPAEESPVMIADNDNSQDEETVAIPPLLAEVGPDSGVNDEAEVGSATSTMDQAGLPEPEEEEVIVPLNQVDDGSGSPPADSGDVPAQPETGSGTGMEAFPVIESDSGPTGLETPDTDTGSDTPVPVVNANVDAEAQALKVLEDEGTMILKAAADPYTAQEISSSEAFYSGPHISLDFKDADIKDVFRLFHEILGYNIVLDPGVSGKLTIVLDDVPADQALDIILKNNGLDKVFENNVIRVATTQKLAQEAASRRQLLEAKELEQEPLTFARKLSYAKADDVVRLLREAGAGGNGGSGGILSRKGNARFDERTNTLIITDIPKNMEGINRLVDLLDEETPQVMIEARIVETDRDFERDFGISWGWQVDLDPAIGTETNARFPHRINVDYDVNLPPPASATSLGLSFGNIRDSWDLNFTLEAFELNGDVKILSSPRIATQNNETAVIEQGTQIPVVNTTATEINVEFISASLRLEVTPQITKDNTIIMEVMVDNSSPDFVNRVGDVPPIITERAETLILVENGGTAVIGGIFKLDESFTEVGVPGLKRIPLLGWLFKNRSVTRGNTELLIFLTPRILERG